MHLNFRNSKITGTTYYGEAGKEHHGRPAGSVLTVSFELNGRSFTALNGGPVFKFNEAVSFQVDCDTQEELDYFWTKLAEGGDARAQQCGWLKDKFGVSWQVVPSMLPELLNDPDKAKSERVFAAVLDMEKLEIPALQRASSVKVSLWGSSELDENAIGAGTVWANYSFIRFINTRKNGECFHPASRTQFSSLQSQRFPTVDYRYWAHSASGCGSHREAVFPLAATIDGRADGDNSETAGENAKKDAAQVQCFARKIPFG